MNAWITVKSVCNWYGQNKFWRCRSLEGGLSHTIVFIALTDRGEPRQNVGLIPPSTSSPLPSPRLISIGPLKLKYSYGDWGLGSAVSSPTGSETEPQRKANFMHSLKILQLAVPVLLGLRVILLRINEHTGQYWWGQMHCDPPNQNNGWVMAHQDHTAEPPC